MSISSFTLSRGATALREGCCIDEFLSKNILSDLQQPRGELTSPVLIADALKFCLILRTFVTLIALFILNSLLKCLFIRLKNPV